MRHVGLQGAVTWDRGFAIVCLAVIGAGAAGCGPPSLQVVGPAPAVLAQRTATLLREVERARGLAARRSVKVRFLAEEPKPKAKAAGDPEIDKLQTLWIAFGFTKWPSKLDRRRKGLKGLFVAGYEPKREEVRVPPDTLRRWRERPERMDSALAHEITHALQDQRFGLARIDKLKGEAWLAAHALFEGDATFTQLLFGALRAGRSRAQAAEAVKRQAARTEAEVDNPWREPESLPLDEGAVLIRKLVGFEYRFGLRFVERLYRSGGQPLVDAAFGHPPVSTAQVLHPELYVGGVEPATVRPPHSPPGWSTVDRGTLGEYLIRVLFEPCMTDADAREAATGWRGDVYAVSSRPPGRLSLTWLVVFGDEASASRFVRAANRMAEAPAGCWNRHWWSAGRHVIAPQLEIRREGSRVAIVRGLDGAEVEAAVAELLQSRVVLPEARPPLGPIRLAEDLPPPPRRRLKMIEGNFHSEPLGLRGPVPPGCLGSLDEDAGQIDIACEVRLSIASFPLPPVAAMAQLEAILKNKSPTGLHLTREQQRTPVGSATVLSSCANTGEACFRVLVIPLCGGRATLSIVESWRDAVGRATAEAWTAALASDGVSPPPICPARVDRR